MQSSLELTNLEHKKISNNKEEALNQSQKGTPRGNLSNLLSALDQEQENVIPLLVEPEQLEGVASAYRYKLNIHNRELYGAIFNFIDQDVFSFHEVNKKRAVKKEDWPLDSTVDHPSRYDVSIKLMAGDSEIKTCGGCSMWKELTEKPLLILTPHGTKCIQYIRKPFLLLIFRCCPKFHSYAKQFKLLINIQSISTGMKYSTTIDIYRKKMHNPKKSNSVKEDSSALRTDTGLSPIINPQYLRSQQQYIAFQQQYQNIQHYQPQVLAEQALSPQTLYKLLYQNDSNRPRESTPNYLPPPSRLAPPYLPTPSSNQIKQQAYFDPSTQPLTFAQQKTLTNTPNRAPSALDDKWLENFLETESKRMYNQRNITK